MATDVDGVTTAEPAQPSTRRERTGWYFYDWANSAFSTTVVAVFIGPYLTGVAEGAAGCETDEACRLASVNVFGFNLAVGSFYPTVIAIAVIINVLILPVIGAIADRSAHKRRLLGLTAFTGAGATTALIFVTEGRYLLGAVLVILATMAFAASIVVSNSFLPQLATEDQRDKVSSTGWAIGYLGGGLLLALNLVALIMLEDTYGAGTMARWSLASAGVWWAVFTLIPLRWLTDRAPSHVVPSRGGVLTGGFRQLWDTIKHLRSFKLTLFFLGAYLVYNDGIQTVINLASVYGTEELGLEQSTLIITILIVQFLAFFGALGLGRMAMVIGAWKTVLISLVLWIAVVLAAYWLPAGDPTKFMLLGACIGIVLGGSQALSRSLFSQLIPAGREAEYFGFYEISDKGTSWLGPALFALVFQLTHSYRLGVVSVIVFFVIGFVLLLFVPMRRAIEAAGNTPPRVL
jgi:UMF1 family MFS transporter